MSTSTSASVIEGAEVVDSFDDLGVLAFTTGRAAGSFGTGTDEPIREVMARWSALRAFVGGSSARLATATQVHGNRVVEHVDSWLGWLRGEDADGHLSLAPGTAMAVTVADCVPVFLAHPSGATAALHSGWRGTAARITEQALAQFRAHGLQASDIRMHCGPAICGKCYEVSASVYAELTGRNPGRPTKIDLRALIADHARVMGVKQISSSQLCTRCDNYRFYSHRAGDAGRQLGVIMSRS
ncbi:MAG: Multi-copper polyphenol oxidoreductase, laccase [Gemmatimonadetes bacterium]|nr:Multi-copper polyphenol oxidoreductase, laccase [Gemmatimonadota bacterium]